MLFWLNSIGGNSILALTVIGDGVTTGLTIDLEALPIDLDLRKDQPAAAFVASGPAGTSASLTNDRKKIVLSFSSAPTSSGVSVTVALEWQSFA